MRAHQGAPSYYLISLESAKYKLCLKFRTEVETDGGEISAGHLEHIAGIGQEYVASGSVGGHKLVFTFLERFQSFGIVAVNPACFVERNRFPAALCAVFVEQTVLDYLKLQLPDCAYNLAAIKLIGKHLGHTLVHELTDTFVKLFGFHGVGVFQIFEHLGREGWETLEMDCLAGSQCVADFEIACIGDADDVAGICFVDDALFLGHERCRGSEAHHLVGADVAVVDVALKFSGANLHEGYT